MGKTNRRRENDDQPKPRKNKTKNRGRERQELRNEVSDWGSKDIEEDLY